MKITWHTEKRKVKDLIPADYNPRKISIQERADLMDSIKQFGAVIPVVINLDNKMIGGHQRLSIYADLGIEEIDVQVPNRQLTIEEEMRLNLRLNKNTGSWDDEKLFKMGQEILEEIGFNNKEITGIFDKHNKATDDFDVEQAKIKAKDTTIKEGDVFELGPHRLICGDATTPLHWEKLMNGKKAQMVFTDPPYNVAYEGGGNYANHGTPKREMIKNDEMSDEEFKNFLDKAIGNMMDHCDGVFYICMSSKELASLKQAFEKHGGHWQSFIIWVKNTFTLSRSDWQNQYEPILYGWNGRNKNHYFTGFRDEGNVWENLDRLKSSYDGEETTIKIGNYHLKIKGKAEGKVCRKNEEVDIWYEKKPTKSSEHPTMKPLALVAKGIKASSTLGEIVIDPFLGSGTTLIASDQIGRICYGMELDPQYVQVIIDRWELLTGKKALKI